jgi:hypothetical protein
MYTCLTELIDFSGWLLRGTSAGERHLRAVNHVITGHECHIEGFRCTFYLFWDD